MRTKFASAGLGCMALLAAASTAQAAICDDRPGTPVTLNAQVTSATSIRFNFRPTTRADEVNKYYDYTVYEVLESGKQVNVRNQGGVPPHSPHHTSTSYFNINDLKPGSKYCFIVKARSERGVKGCVSLKWSAPICAEIEGGLGKKGPYGAVAADGKGRWGYAVAQATGEQARANAIRGCGSTACKVELSGRGTCAAYAYTNKGGYWYGLGMSTDNYMGARTAAELGCQKGAPNKASCKILKTYCAPKR